MTLAAVETVRERLGRIFPEGTAERPYLVRELAAKTVLTFLFVRAIGDPNNPGVRLLRPSMVTWLDDESLGRVDDDAFVADWYANAVAGQAELRAFLDNVGVTARRWYADNSREPIRDEVIRPLAEHYGAVLRRADVATTSAQPALALTSDFAALFDEDVADEELDRRIGEWQAAHLGAAERARLTALRRLAADTKEVLVSLPGRGERRLPPGESSAIVAAVIAEFAPRMLQSPFVLAVCHSRDPLAADDARELANVGLALDASVALPDVLLIDATTGVVWFVEVVATAGEIHDRRLAELREWAERAGLDPVRCRFVTAFRTRSAGVFRRAASTLAWNTLAWFADEPDRLIELRALD